MADPPLTPETLPEQHESDDQETSRQKLRLLAASYSEGPIPSIREIREWQQILPDAPERFLSLLEQASKHEMEMDKAALALQREIVDKNFCLLTRGQIFGFLIVSWLIGRAVPLHKQE